MEERYAQAQQSELNIFKASNKQFNRYRVIVEIESMGIKMEEVTGRVLDVGGGCGYYASLFNAACERIVVDPLYDHFGISLGNVIGISCGGEELPFPSHSFDFIIVRNVIDHMLEPLVLLKEAHRVLKPNGEVYFMINTFLRFLKIVFLPLNLLDKPHPLHFTVNDVRRLLKDAGFCIKRERVAPSSHFEWRLKRIIGMLIKREYYAILSK